MSIVFQVIDLNCEQSDQTFFVPNVVMTTISTSKFATLRGYSEFGTPSSPPKKYRSITFTGFSQRVAFTGEETPRQCGGAKYVYSGTGTVDNNGNQISVYSKNFYAQCQKQYWPLEPLQANDRAINTGSSTGISQFVGFCWPGIANSCPVCDPNDANWAFIGNQATGNPAVDLGAFIHGVNDPVVTKTSYSINDVFNALTSIEPDVTYDATVSGHLYNVTVGANVYGAQSVVTNPSPLDFPVVAIQDSGGNYLIGDYVIFTDTNNYSAVLSDEYTDADALANAQTVVGSGRVAENIPRTTGFTSITTRVDFTLKCGNLINGSNYVVTIEYLDVNSGAVILQQYPFTANGTTHTITDTIPTPAAGHSTQIKNPSISFA